MISDLSKPRTLDQILASYRLVWDACIPLTEELILLLSEHGHVSVQVVPGRWRNRRIFLLFLAEEQQLITLDGREEAWEWWLAHHAPADFQVPRSVAPWELPSQAEVA